VYAWGALYHPSNRVFSTQVPVSYICPILHSAYSASDTVKWGLCALCPAPVPTSVICACVEQLVVLCIVILEEKGVQNKVGQVKESTFFY
jgi:hypothetical protein